MVAKHNLEAAQGKHSYTVKTNHLSDLVIYILYQNYTV